MPTSDLDMPLLPSAEQIRRREFATVRRGYDPQQVRAYLTSIANQVGTLERELSQLRLEVGSAAARGQTDQLSAGGCGAGARARRIRERRSVRRTVQALRHVDRDGGSGGRADPRERAVGVRAHPRRGQERGRPDQGRRAGARRGSPAGGDGAVGASPHGIGSRADGPRRAPSWARHAAGRDAIEAPHGGRRPGGADRRSRPGRGGGCRPRRAVGGRRAGCRFGWERSRSDATPTPTSAEAPVDPRYEDLWVQRDESIQIPDLASIDLDFDDRDE